MDYYTLKILDKEILLDFEDFQKLSQYKWKLVTCKSPFLVYAYRNFKDKDTKKLHSIRMHREILGITDPKQIVDHINGHTLDNRKENLRLADPTTNARNRRSRYNASSKYPGVHYNKLRKNWRSQININRKSYCLGSFKTEIDAYNARLKYIEENQLFGYRKVI